MFDARAAIERVFREQYVRAIALRMTTATRLTTSASDVHLLSSRARARSADRAHVTVAWRTDDGGNRERVPCFRGDDGAATSTRQGQDSRCAHSVSRAALLPQAHETNGLLALMLLIHARRDARTTADGALMSVADQQRALWNSALIAEGLDLVRACLRANRPGPYQLQSAIQAVHSDAARADETDWAQILALYDQLLAMSPNPVVAINRAVAVGQVHGASAALIALEQHPLPEYHVHHAVRGELLDRLGRHGEAVDA